jgi:hypothetical protein
MTPKYLNYILFIAISLLVTVKSQGQDKNIDPALYKAAGIPDSLKEDANSVLRYSMVDFAVSGPGKAVDKIHTIVTILNEKGDNEARKVLHYNKKYNSISSYEMKIYNADGTLLKKYHKSDMYDRAAIDNESIITDDRILAIEHTISSYPVTVEMIYEDDNRSLIDLGLWQIQIPEQSIQNSYFHLSIAADAGFRYLNRNTKVKPIKTNTDKLETYAWQVSNLKAIKIEEGAESWCVLPKIYMAANNFEFYSIPGNISSWQSYGKWLQDLNADVCKLSPQREAEIRKMTDTIKSDKDKARFLYRYMQQSMRYVSVKLGIGGLKPFAASFVDDKKYGDCKALSNYMCALLKAVNIPSYCAIINAGSNLEPADPSFPYHPFNHEILCVPFKGDTTWLECTSSIQPFGKLGPFTENRNALIVTEDGGKLVSTPKSIAQDNQFNSETHIVLDADGGARAQVKIFSTGEYRAMYIGMAEIKADEQKEFLLRDLNIKQPSAFDFTSGQDGNYTKEIDLNLEYDKFCDVIAGDKQFYKPWAFSLWHSTVPIEEKRKSDFYFEFPLQKSSVTTIDLPTGFEVETLPANQSLKFTYGNYDIKYVYDAAKNQVVSTAKFNLNNQVIPAAKYTELQQYIDAVARAQNKKLVIKRKA